MEFEDKAKEAEAQGDYLSAIKYYSQALESLKEMQLLEGLQFEYGRIFQRIATLYTEIGDYKNAVSSFDKASKYYLESDEPLTKIYRLVGECYTNIGACHLAENNFKEAFSFFKKASESTIKATELEEEILRRYIVERTIFNMALGVLCLINLKKKNKEILSYLEKAISLSQNYNVKGLAPNLILFFQHILTEKYSEARMILKNEIEDAAEAMLLGSPLQAAILGLIEDLAAKHIPEARIQIQDKIIEEKGEVILTTKIYQDMILHGLSFANKKMPQSEYREVYGLIVGKIKKDDVIISEIVPIMSGSEVEVEFKNEHYTKAAIIDSMAAERNEFIVGWFHTHPGLGLFLSPTDVINQLGYQSVNNKAIAIVFDFTKLTPLEPGFAIFRLDDPSMGHASNYHLVRWRIKDAPKNLFAESITFFEKFLLQLNNLILKKRQMTIPQLATELGRSEFLLEEIIPQLVALQYLPNIHYDPSNKIISIKD